MRRGFTLIEVLIGTIVLGLGLLGLAAVFPAVVIQQRSASDAVQADSVAESAVRLLTSRSDLMAPDRGFDLLRQAEGTAGDDFSMWANADGQWVLPFSSDNNYSAGVFSFDDQTGDLRFGDATSAVILPVRERLFPSPRPGVGSASDEPRFVWDLAMRRLPLQRDPVTPSADDPIEVVVFVRRIDPGVRRGARGEQGATLHDRFDPPGAGQPAFVPVSVDRFGVPSFDGRVRGGADPLRYSGVYRFALAYPAGTAVGDVVREFRVDLAPLTLDAGIANTERVLPALARVGQLYSAAPDGGRIELRVTAVRRVATDTLVTVEPGVVRRANVPSFDVLATPQPAVAIRSVIIGKPQP